MLKQRCKGRGHCHIHHCLTNNFQESDTGLAPPHLWDIAADRQRMQEDHPLQVARCTKIIQDEKDAEKSKYVINVKQIAKFVVKLGDRVSSTDIEEGMRVGYVTYRILMHVIYLLLSKS